MKKQTKPQRMNKRTRSDFNTWKIIALVEVILIIFALGYLVDRNREHLRSKEIVKDCQVPSPQNPIKGFIGNGKLRNFNATSEISCLRIVP